jgi:hypothetical protein
MEAFRGCEHDISALQLEDLSLYQGFSDLVPGGFHNPGESRA